MKCVVVLATSSGAVQLKPGQILDVDPESLVPNGMRRNMETYRCRARIPGTSSEFPIVSFYLKRLNTAENIFIHQADESRDGAIILRNIRDDSRVQVSKADFQADIRDRSDFEALLQSAAFMRGASKFTQVHGFLTLRAKPVPAR